MNAIENVWGEGATEDIDLRLQELFNERYPAHPSERMTWEEQGYSWKDGKLYNSDGVECELDTGNPIGSFEKTADALSEAFSKVVEGLYDDNSNKEGRMKEDVEKSNFAYVPLCWCAARNEEEIMRCKYRSGYSEGTCGYRSDDPNEPTCNNGHAKRAAFIREIGKYSLDEIITNIVSPDKFENHKWAEY